ncbi:MAG TPA: neutral/alkaline non-lysosomal ceramidase N-terminal domain-containing protein [Planctomycetota bacterium]|nr:neutral/alkaline non-lysosomal ceramidase N-terminal domain-containing protein [Planctomycetota bacterium]
MNRCFIFSGLLLILASGLRAQEEAPVFRAGFGEIEITPPLGSPKQGANAKTVATSVLDPLYARAAVFERGSERFAILQLDTALIPVAETRRIREKAQKDYEFPPERIMVAATHNHAGPALVNEGLPRDEAYISGLVEKCAQALGLALRARTPAQIAVGTAFEFAVSFNRRILMRDGTVRTHGSFKDPQALSFEGPIDPELGVLAVRGKDGVLLGALINFACHPTAHWNDGVLSAGFPGVAARILKEKGIPVPLFLQGAAGNMHTQDPRGFPEKSMEEIGRTLAGDAERALSGAPWFVPKTLSASSRTLSLAFRTLTPEDLSGTGKGMQRFGEKGYYDRKIPELLKYMEKGNEEGEVQMFRLDSLAFVSQPSESFAEHGLRIKESAWPVRAWVVGYANGMLGYLPHEEAFRHGGYECTFGPPSLMAPDTGSRLAQAAIELIRGR